MAQVTWKELVTVRMVDAMGRSARARGLIADVLRDLRSPELVADAQSLPHRAHRAEGRLAQASRLLEEAASIMAAAWHIGTRAAAAIQATKPPRHATDGEVQRLRSGLGLLQDARARAEKACRFAEDSRNEMYVARLLLHQPHVHLQDRPLDLRLRRAAAILSLDLARNFELESVSLASKAADCLS